MFLKAVNCTAATKLKKDRLIYWQKLNKQIFFFGSILIPAISKVNFSQHVLARSILKTFWLQSETFWFSVLKLFNSLGFSIKKNYIEKVSDSVMEIFGIKKSQIRYRNKIIKNILDLSVWNMALDDCTSFCCVSQTPLVKISVDFGTLNLGSFLRSGFFFWKMSKQPLTPSCFGILHCGCFVNVLHFM